MRISDEKVRFLGLVGAVLLVVCVPAAGNECAGELASGPNVQVVGVDIDWLPQSEDREAVLILQLDRDVRNRGGRLILPNQESWAELVNVWALAGRDIEVLSDPRVPYDAPTRTLLVYHFEEDVDDIEKGSLGPLRARLLTGRHVRLELESSRSEFLFRISEVKFVRDLGEPPGYYEIRVVIDEPQTLYLAGYARLVATRGTEQEFYSLPAERSDEEASKVDLMMEGSDEPVIGFSDLRTLPPNNGFILYYLENLGGMPVEDFVEQLPGMEFRFRDSAGQTPWLPLDSPFPSSP